MSLTVPEVTFHFNVASIAPYVCRLLYKAHQAGMRALVCLPEPELHQLDVALWAQDAETFIPHARYDTVLGRPVLAPSPIALADQACVWPAAQVLIHALPVPVLPPDCQRYTKLIEVVPLADEHRLAARQRWHQYVAQGWPLRRHDAGSSQR